MHPQTTESPADAILTLAAGDSAFDLDAFDLDALLKMPPLHSALGSEDDVVSLSAFDGLRSDQAGHAQPGKTRRPATVRFSPRKVVKQRCYEKLYRYRIKSTRANYRIEWLRAEQNMREVLAQQAKRVIHDAHKLDNASKPLRDQLAQVLLERDAIMQDSATMASLLALFVALEFWGFKSPNGLSVRTEINELPKVDVDKKYVFEW